MKLFDKNIDPLKLGVFGPCGTSQRHLKFQRGRDQCFLITGSTMPSEGIIGVNL